MRHALRKAVLPAVLAVALVGCGAAQLDPATIASRIHLRPTSLALQAGLDMTRVGILAGVEACNRNDVDVELVRADWTAQLDSLAIGAGSVRGPVTLVAQKCQELKMDGAVDLTRAGAAAVSAVLLGQPLAPVLVVDLVAAVWGVSVERRVRLEGFGVAERAVGPGVAEPGAGGGGE